MAEYYMKHLVESRGLSSLFEIDSAATTNEELGNPVHPGTRRALAEHSIPCGSHRARKMRAEEYTEWDYIVAMDEENLGGLARILGKQFSWRDNAFEIIKEADVDNKISLLLDYTDHPRDVADPWYTGNFDATWKDVEAGCQGLLEHIMNK